MEVTRSKLVEAELNQFIEKRHDQRVSDEGQRPAEEVWAESQRRCFARRREENRVAWVAATTAASPPLCGCGPRSTTRRRCSWRTEPARSSANE